jgi:hypothetical protein
MSHLDTFKNKSFLLGIFNTKFCFKKQYMNVCMLVLFIFKSWDVTMCISKGRGPIKSLPECLPGESPRRHMVGADPSVNVGQKGMAFFPRDATELDSPFAVTIKLDVNQHIHLYLAGQSFPLECRLLAASGT